MTKRIVYTNEEFRKYISTKNPNVEILSDYRGSENKVLVKQKQCGHVYEDYSKNIQGNRGCPVCNYTIMQRGVNDLWITAPNVAVYLEDPEDCLYAPNSTKRTWFICRECKFRKYTSVANINRFGIGCPCSCDGYSLGEKTMMYILNKNNISYVTQKTFKWSGKKKYDFYIQDKSLIIEVNGLQHSKGINFYSKRNETKNDKYKYDIAKENGIANYVYIDYSVCTSKYLIEQVKSSILTELLNLDFSILDEKECFLFCSTSFKRKVWELWNNGFNSKEISSELKLATNTITHYLNEGNKYGITNYDGSLEKKKGSYHKVICINTLEVFDGIQVAQDKYNINNIAACCIGNIKSAGKHPDTNEPLMWMYYDDYLANGLKEYDNKNRKKLVCINNNYLFNTLEEGAKWAGLKTSGSITQFLRRDGNHEYAGKHPDTHEKLKWMYYEDYIKKFDASALIEYQSI